MPWVQHRAPNLNQTSNAGMCLYFARSAFGAPAVEASAWNGWTRAKYRHEDRNLPDVPVPVWWVHNGAYGTPPEWDNWGHVAIYVPGRGVLSSPITRAGNGQQWFPSIDALTNEINRILPKSGTRYVGWSEDISNVRVVEPKEEEVKIGTGDNWRWRMNRLHRQLVGNWDMGDATWNSIKGQEVWKVIESWSDHSNAGLALQQQEVGEIALREGWQDKIAAIKTLEAQVNGLETERDESKARILELEATTAASTELAKDLAKDVEELRAQVAAYRAQVATLETELEAEKAKPPVEVVKEVEVIKEVPAVPESVDNWFSRLVDKLNKNTRRR